MSFYGGFKINFVEAESEQALQKKMSELEFKHDAMLKVINIYRHNSKVVAWYYHDLLKAGAPKPQNASVKKVNKKAK